MMTSHENNNADGGNAASDMTGEEAFQLAQAMLGSRAAAHDAAVEASSPSMMNEIRERKRVLEVNERAKEELDKERAARLFTEPDAPMTLAEELAKEYPPLTARIEGLSWVGGTVTIAAKAKTGKTTLGLNLVRSLADGTPFLGQLPVTPPRGRIAYVNYEMSNVQMNDWFRRANIRHPERVVPLHLKGEPMPLLADETRDWYVKWAIEREIEVLIMDPWSKVLVGSGSEDKNDDVNAATAVLDRIKHEAGISDLFMIAHMGHAEHEDGQERARGASAFMGWPDVMWTLNRSGDVRLLQAEGRDVQFASSELVMDAETVTLSLTGVRATKTEINVKKAADEVVAIVSAEPGLPTTELKSRITATNNGGQRTKAVEAAVNSGRVHVRHGKNSAKLHYPGVGGDADTDLTDPGLRGFIQSVSGG